MRYPACEKLEIIQLVEHSHLPVRRTLVNIEFESLAATAELSLYHFARTFKQSEGTTPHTFVLERRLARARELLARTDLSLSEVAFAVGFADQSHFTRRFRQMVGVSPGQFRKL